MPDEETTTTGYTMGYSEEFRQLLNRRSLETHAAHLLPHLKPGLRVLGLRLRAGDTFGRTGPGGGPRRGAWD